jgi:hypothetical protein
LIKVTNFSCDKNFALPEVEEERSGGGKRITEKRGGRGLLGGRGVV